MKKANVNNMIVYGILGLIIIVFIVAVSGLGLKGVWGADISNKHEQKGQQQSDALESVSTGTMNMGDVSVELQPHKVQDGKIIVDIRTNTHSVSLDRLDLKQATVLEYEGNALHPIEAPGFSGHHNSGQLVFKVDKDLKEFRIIIEGIPKLQQRIFEWS